MSENKPIVNPFQLSRQLLEQLQEAPAPELSWTALPQVDVSAGYVDNLFNKDEIELIRTDIETQEWVPVGVNGIFSDYRPGEMIGSYRASCFTPKLAELIWDRLRTLFAVEQEMDEQTKTDWQPWPRWRPIGINPLMRLINYHQSGLLIPHYDAPYDDKQAGTRTLKTVVIYLRSDPEMIGGQTRFITDPQDQLPFSERDFSDRARPATADEIIAEVEPRPGRALIFDHRLLHDSSALSGNGEKTLLRTDIVYTPVR